MAWVSYVRTKGIKQTHNNNHYNETHSSLSKEWVIFAGLDDRQSQVVHTESSGSMHRHKVKSTPPTLELSPQEQGQTFTGGLKCTDLHEISTC